MVGLVVLTGATNLAITGNTGIRVKEAELPPVKMYENRSASPGQLSEAPPMNLARVQEVPGTTALTRGTVITLKFPKSRFTAAQRAAIEEKVAGANTRIASGRHPATIGNQVPYSSYASRSFARAVLAPDAPVSTVKVPPTVAVDEYVSRLVGGPQSRTNQHFMDRWLNSTIGKYEQLQTKAADLPEGTQIQAYRIEWVDE
jgi:hypothetical protein